MTLRSIKFTSLAVLGLGVLALAGAADQKKDNTMTAKPSLEPGLYAKFETTDGNFVVRLFPKDAPKTVENFVGLAEGKKEFTDVKTGKPTKRPFYDGTVFHRVIPNFMIQGGCPLGTGTGDPGYRFDDEFGSGRTFIKKGILAMANAGPGTNGSQFFITVAETPWLNNHHTIFGEVVEGYDVVEKISFEKRNSQDKPLVPVVLNKVVIEQVGSK